MGVEVRLEGVRHEYGRTEETAAVRALEDVTVTIRPSDFVILKGPSGSGKSTLLNLIGAVDRPSEGRIFVGDDEISAMSERELTLVRRRAIGFVFQFFNLIPTLRVHENVAFPLSLIGFPGAEGAERVATVLEEIGLTHRADHYPNQLSGGEMQRVAIGRAIVHRPELIIADEPTGNLDSHTGETILRLIRGVHDRYRPTVVMATHSDRAASFGNYILEMMDGRLKGPGSRVAGPGSDSADPAPGTRHPAP